VTDQRNETRAEGTLPRPITAHQLGQLHEHFEALREQRRSLLSNLRSLTQETISHGARLRGEWHQRADVMVAPATAEEQWREQYGMTPREIEVARLLAEGLSNFAVARELEISPHTARHHTQRVLGKLGVHSRAQAAAKLRS
jgi:DNA-binding NarL/FixJ family response regulator